LDAFSVFEKGEVRYVLRI